MQLFLHACCWTAQQLNSFNACRVWGAHLLQSPLLAAAWATLVALHAPTPADNTGKMQSFEFGHT
jgi:hypothetical protein